VSAIYARPIGNCILFTVPPLLHVPRRDPRRSSFPVNAHHPEFHYDLEDLVYSPNFNSSIANDSLHLIIRFYTTIMTKSVANAGLPSLNETVSKNSLTYLSMILSNSDTRSFWPSVEQVILFGRSGSKRIALLRLLQPLADRIHLVLIIQLLDDPKFQIRQEAHRILHLAPTTQVARALGLARISFEAMRKLTVTFPYLLNDDVAESSTPPDSPLISSHPDDQPQSLIVAADDQTALSSSSSSSSSSDRPFRSALRQASHLRREKSRVVFATPPRPLSTHRSLSSKRRRSHCRLFRRSAISAPEKPETVSNPPPPTFERLEPSHSSAFPFPFRDLSSDTWIEKVSFSS
jgi:hypothetical protein